MHLSIRLSLTVAGLLVSVGVLAQRRLNNAYTLLVPQAQVEVPLRGNDYVLAAYAPVVYAGSGSGTRFEKGQFSLGYEHFWNEHWSGGLTLRHTPRLHQQNNELLDLPGSTVPGALVRHRSILGPIGLGQRLGLEYAFPRYQLTESQNRALARLRLDADHVFALTERVAVRPRLAYEAVAYLRFQRDEDQLQERTIDFGSLRGEVGLRLSPRLDFTPWAALQRIYRNSILLRDSNGNVVSGGKVNFATTVVGLDARLTLGRRAAATDRQPLPTQH